MSFDGLKIKRSLRHGLWIALSLAAACCRQSALEWAPDSAGNSGRHAAGATTQPPGSRGDVSVSRADAPGGLTPPGEQGAADGVARADTPGGLTPPGEQGAADGVARAETSLLRNKDDRGSTATTAPPSSNAEQCRRELDRERAQTRAPRIASWNVRWFPDGGSAARRTDVEWLACEMVALGAPVIAVQEFTVTARDQEPLRRLLDELDRLSAGRWQAQFDRCPGRRFQHVGLLYDAARVSASHFVQLDQLNPRQGCTGRLRPGLSGYFRFPGGPDLHVVSVHLKAEFKRSARQLRRRSLRRLPEAVAQLRRLVDDEDVLIAGDLNSVGSRPNISAEQELSEMEALLATQSPPFRRVPSQCSHYHRGKPTSVDHFLITSRSTELPAARAVSTHGYCGALACRPAKPLPAAYDKLSDHCPIVVELDMRDDD